MIHSDIRGRVLSRLEWDGTAAAAKTAATAALNEGQRLFAWLTLCLEATRPLTLTPGLNHYWMYAEGWSDWLVPLRVRLANPASPGSTTSWDTVQADLGMPNEQSFPALPANTKPKLRPASAYEMAAENAAWLIDTGTPTMYGSLGWDFVFFNKRPTLVGQQVLITHARSPRPLVGDNDVPEIHDADHEGLIEYGIWRLRCNEGGQELQAANPLLKNFLDNAKQRANEVRARSLAQRYDRQPFELEGFDYSRLLKSRADLPPYRKENRWTGQA